MYFDGDSSKIWANDSYSESGDVIIGDLDSKRMDSLYFSSCNSGNPDISNTADAFLNIITTNEVTAWDGGTIYNYEKKVLESGPYSNWINENIL